MTSDTRRILITHSNETLRHVLADQLAVHGFEPIALASGAETVAYLAANCADILLIHEQVSDMTAPDLCQTLRRGGLDIPIFVLGPAQEAEKWRKSAEGIEYIEQPFRFPSLLKRLNAALESGSAPQSQRIKHLTFDAIRRTITDDKGDAALLTEKEAAIIHYLLKQEGRAASREDLLANVWGYAPGATTHTVETHIYRLRRKLGDKASILVTGQGGYRLSKEE